MTNTVINFRTGHTHVLRCTDGRYVTACGIVVPLVHADGSFVGGGPWWQHGNSKTRPTCQRCVRIDYRGR